ncbi:MAG TPA: hypothetical protein VF765_30110 [Polyangiaceae bacterium]
MLTGALVGCAEHNQAGATAPQGYAPTSAMAAACPLAQLKGVHATVQDIDHGVAITFTAPKREVDQLRDNVHSMADANDKQGNAFASCPCGQKGTAATGVTEAMPGPTADASVTEIETGAILKLKAKDDSQVDALRSSTRENVKALKTGCLNQSAAPGR